MLHKAIFKINACLALLMMCCTAWATSSIVSDILNQDVDLAYGEYLASECAGCHNPQADASTSVPAIHGVEARDIIEALLAYRSGERTNTTMQGVAGALGDEEIAALAAFLSSN